MRARATAVNADRSEFHRASSRILIASLLVAACGPNAASGPEHPETPEAVMRDTRVVHEDCDTASPNAQSVDVNSDGRADIKSVMLGGRVVCRSVDLNFDGVVDTWIYNDDNGQVRRRESDYDRDGRIDEVAIFSAGKIVEKQRATTLAGKLDTWHFYQDGVLSRTERDSDGDAQIDQWWEYLEGRTAECPLIHSDVDNDGRPDPGATVDSCGKDSGYVPPERYNQAASADFGKADDLPSELEQTDGEGAEGGSSAEPPAEGNGGAP